MGTGFSKKKKQARELQEQMMRMQSQMQKSEITGSAANGLVTITLTGDFVMKDIKIKPECVDPEDIEGLQVLIKAAYADAVEKLQKAQSSSMPQIPGMPDLSNFF